VLATDKGGMTKSDIASESTWADVLRETEFGFKRHNLKVMISVNSQPGSCAVHYTPVVGGEGLDAGWTPAKFTTDPKYYEIACSCGTNTPKLHIDAMSDREVQFQCEASNPTKSTKESH